MNARALWHADSLIGDDPDHCAPYAPGSGSAVRTTVDHTPEPQRLVLAGSGKRSELFGIMKGKSERKKEVRFLPDLRSAK